MVQHLVSILFILHMNPYNCKNTMERHGLDWASMFEISAVSVMVCVLFSQNNLFEKVWKKINDEENLFSFVLCAGTCVFLWCIAEFVACITCCSCKLYVKSSCFHYHFNAIQLIAICDRSGVVLYTILSVQITHWNANEWICRLQKKHQDKLANKINISSKRKKLHRNNNKSFFSMKKE